MLSSRFNSSFIGMVVESNKEIIWAIIRNIQFFNSWIFGTRRKLSTPEHVSWSLLTLIWLTTKINWKKCRWWRKRNLKSYVLVFSSGDEQSFCLYCATVKYPWMVIKTLLQGVQFWLSQQLWNPQNLDSKVNIFLED